MGKEKYKGEVCGPGHAVFLDNFFRRIFQSPGKIVGEYISKWNTVIDLGCGPGYFSVDMAKMVGAMGKVYAVDLQKEMLKKVEKKAEKYGVSDRMIFHQCGEETIGLADTVEADFILAFYMVHEVPDQKIFLQQVKNLLKKGGRFLLSEPNFHVTKSGFQKTADIVKELGFTIVDRPKGKGGRALLLTI